jgi:hypothetical protein
VARLQFFRAVAQERQEGRGYMSAHACGIVVAALHLIVASLTSRMMASSNEMKMYDG